MIHLNNEYSSIAIVGSGPAGSMASLFLSQKKIPHTLIDKSDFPRDKVCGDGLSGKVVSVLKKLDPTLVDEFVRDNKHFLGSWGVLFVAPNGKKLEIPFKKDMTREPHPPGFVSKRIDFDDFLFKKTNTPHAKRITNAEVTALKKTNSGIEITFMKEGISHLLVSQIVIAADGERSITERTFFNRPLQPKHYFAGVRGYYRGVKDMHPQNFIELHFIKSLLPGYFWIFPLPDGYANVGICVLSSRVRSEKLNLRKKMEDIIESDPIIKKRFTEAKSVSKIMGWGLPLGSGINKLSGDHVILTGDAASLIDPFTGEGIGNAMFSGMLAAQVAMKALAQQNFSSDFLFKNYDQEILKSLGDELKLSHTMQKLCKKPWLFNFVASRSEKNNTLRDTISCMFEDLDLRSRLRDPVYYFKLLFNW